MLAFVRLINNEPSVSQGGSCLSQPAQVGTGLAITNDQSDGDDHPYAAMPDAGQVDTLKNKSDKDFVGYGGQNQAQIPGGELPQPPPYTLHY
jgi:hypothetical protein